MNGLAGEVREERAMDPILPAELRRPLDDGELDAILDRAAGGKGAAAAESKVVPMRAARRRWAFYAGIAGPLAAAAVAVLVLRPMTGSNQTGSGIPPYELIIEGGDRETRGAADEAPQPVVHVTRTGRLVIVARPRVPGHSAVSAKAMIERADGSLVPWAVEARASEEGAVRIEARGSAIAALPAGSSRVVVFVGEAASLPADDAAARTAMHGDVPGVRALVQAVEVAP
jgi:hypothetical protein